MPFDGHLREKGPADGREQHGEDRLRLKSTNWTELGATGKSCQGQEKIEISGGRPMFQRERKGLSQSVMSFAITLI